MTWRDKLELGLKEDAAFRRDNLPPDEVHGREGAPQPGRSPVVTEVRDRRQPPNGGIEQPPAAEGAAEAQGTDMENEGQGHGRRRPDS
jgi:hypothetical protein